VGVDPRAPAARHPRVLHALAHHLRTRSRGLADRKLSKLKASPLPDGGFCVTGQGARARAGTPRR
jgi:hypothetical protein